MACGAASDAIEVCVTLGPGRWMTNIEAEGGPVGNGVISVGGLSQ
jgi:hypothetical protein